MATYVPCYFLVTSPQAAAFLPFLFLWPSLAAEKGCLAREAGGPKWASGLDRPGAGGTIPFSSLAKGVGRT